MGRNGIAVDLEALVKRKNGVALVVANDDRTLHRIEKAAQFFVIEAFPSIDGVVLILNALVRGVYEKTARGVVVLFDDVLVIHVLDDDGC